MERRWITVGLVLLRQLNDVLDRRTKQQIFVGTGASIVIALLDMFAIALVLPLVNLAAGATTQPGTTSLTSRMFGDPEQATLTLILAVLVVSLFVLKNLGAIAYTWWLAGFKTNNQVRLSSRLLHHFLTSPYTQVSSRSSADMMRTMSDASAQVFGSVVNGAMTAVASGASILAIMAALLISAPVPALAAGLYFGVSSYIYLRVIKPRMSAAGSVASDAAQGAWRTAFAALGGLKELKLRGTQDHFIRNYESESMRGARAMRLREMLGGLPRYLLEIAFILAIGLILLTNTLTTSAGSAPQNVGMLALFVAAGFRVLPSITGLLGSVSAIKFGAPFLQLVHTEVMARRDAVATRELELPKLPFRDVVRVESVCFRYPTSSVNALQSVNIAIERGHTVALVGGSGAGKTTLVDVILGLHDPIEGRVTVDGVDILWQKRAWQANIGYVPQDVYLLDGTLAQNIAFDQEPNEIDGPQLCSAVAQAQLNELVAALPDGTDTPIGEKGSRLSGGQRQRVGIARALYLRPDLLVLDEATAALDNETEHRITETIRALRGSITVLVVAHRLSTVRHADQVVFMKDGRVECVGTFEEVRRRSAEFEKLVRLGSLGEPDAEPPVPENIVEPEHAVADARCME